MRFVVGAVLAVLSLPGPAPGQGCSGGASLSFQLRERPGFFGRRGPSVSFAYAAPPSFAPSYGGPAGYGYGGYCPPAGYAFPQAPFAYGAPSYYGGPDYGGLAPRQFQDYGYAPQYFAEPAYRPGAPPFSPFAGVAGAGSYYLPQFQGAGPAGRTPD